QHAEEALIVAVYPELYNISSSDYHNLSKCKYTRDKYLRERRLEQNKGSGAAGGTFRKRWKYMSALSFLEPHVKERTTSSNFSQANESQETAASLLESIVFINPNFCLEYSMLHSFSLHHQTTPSLPQFHVLHQFIAQPQVNAAPLLSHQDSRFQEGVLEALGKDEDEDEDFLKSLLPSLRRPSPNNKFEARIKLLKALHDVETRRLTPTP
uniref:BESS domain-containing protein n=1 Tax=Cyprinus carpio TaxID=7962 RepID=A0A8C1PIT0_CYPCA